MKRIKIHGIHGEGKYALIDDEDYEIVNLFRWNAIKCKYGLRCFTPIFDNGKRQTIYLHRLIMNTPIGMDTDHINHDTLDNRKKNMRVCTHQQNLMNYISNNGTSKYKGTHWCKTRNMWIAKIMFFGKGKYIGQFHEEKAAAQAYNFMAYKLFGEFAHFNNVGVT